VNCVRRRRTGAAGALAAPLPFSFIQRSSTCSQVSAPNESSESAASLTIVAVKTLSSTFVTDSCSESYVAEHCLRKDEVHGGADGSVREGSVVCGRTD
jgi:hypothetical protein